jgi:hypothetical protein
MIGSDPPGPGVVECDRETTSATEAWIYDNVDYRGAWIYDNVDYRGRVARSCGGRKPMAEGFRPERRARGAS